MKFAMVDQTHYHLVDYEKSDVYRLGLVFLFMACLGPAKSVLWREKFRVAKVKEDINGLPYSEIFKSLLRWMLQTKEARRPLFTDISQWLNT